MILTEVEICTAVVLPHCIESEISFLYVSLSSYYIKIFQSEFIYRNKIHIFTMCQCLFFDNTDKFCWNSVYMGTVLNWYEPNLYSC